MGLRYPNQKYGQCYFVTTSFVNREKFGNINGVYDALVGSLVFYANKYGVQIAGYVFMPSHIHLLIFIEGDRLAVFMRDYKKYTAQKAIKECGLNGKNIWMPRYDRVVINSEKIFRRKLDYIHNNPVKSGLAERAGDWLWSSARDYEIDYVRKIPIWKGWF
jgi:REP element-mobilizing transposase RayT